MPSVNPYLSPFVYWAQSEDSVSLRVDLRSVTCPQVNLTNKTLKFTANGVGAKGHNEYHFNLDFFEDVHPEASQYKVTDREVEIMVHKKENKLWPRLITQQMKPAWLKVDFDRLKTEDDDDEEEDEIEDDYSTKDYLKKSSPYHNILEEHSWRKKKPQKKVEDFRKIYLFLYNLFQFVGFLYILIVMSIRYAKEGPSSMEGTYLAVGKAFKFCQLLQILEIVHPLLGYTPGSPLFPFLQVGGRLFMIFAMVDAEPRIQSKPVVFYLFFAYAVIESVRYPYYMLRTYNVDNGFLTWLRYTIWIPLYPLGFICEGIVILRNIPYFEETEKFSVFLPNKWNISFYFPTLMRIFLLLGFFPSMYFMMTHMYHQRVKILGHRREKDD